MTLAESYEAKWETEPRTLRHCRRGRKFPCGEETLGGELKCVMKEGHPGRRQPHQVFGQKQAPHVRDTERHGARWW